MHYWRLALLAFNLILIAWWYYLHERRLRRQARAEREKARFRRMAVPLLKTAWVVKLCRRLDGSRIREMLRKHLAKKPDFEEWQRQRLHNNPPTE